MSFLEIQVKFSFPDPVLRSDRGLLNIQSQSQGGRGGGFTAWGALLVFSTAGIRKHPHLGPHHGSLLTPHHQPTHTYIDTQISPTRRSCLGQPWPPGPVLAPVMFVHLSDGIYHAVWEDNKAGDGAWVGHLTVGTQGSHFFLYLEFYSDCQF